MRLRSLFSDLVVFDPGENFDCSYCAFVYFEVLACVVLFVMIFLSVCVIYILFLLTTNILGL